VSVAEDLGGEEVIGASTYNANGQAEGDAEPDLLDETTVDCSVMFRS